MPDTILDVTQFRRVLPSEIGDSVFIPVVDLSAPASPAIASIQSIATEVASRVSFSASEIGGTTSTSFWLDSDANGPKLKNVSGALQIRNGDDTAFADFRVNGLIADGYINGRNQAVTVSASRTITAGDAGKVLFVESASPVTLTVDASQMRVDDVVVVVRWGAGAVSLSGVSLRFPSAVFNPNVAYQYSAVTLYFKSSSDCWVSGALEVV